MQQQEPKFRKEIARRPADPQQMRHLANDRDEDETFDESPHHRRGNEGRHPAHAQCAKEQEDGTDQDGQSRGQCIEIRRTLSRDGAHGQGRDQAGRGVRTDHQQA